MDAWINTGDAISTELHSEVFRLYLEVGWIGLILFMLGLVGLWWRLVRGLRRLPLGQQTVAMRASCALLPPYALTLLTDNTINYASGFGVLVYALAALALADIRERSSVDAAVGVRAGASCELACETLWPADRLVVDVPQGSHCHVWRVLAFEARAIRRAHARASAGACHRRAAATASSSDEPERNFTPSTPSVMSSRSPPISAATIGVPVARASTTTRGNPSYHSEGTTSIAAPFMSSMTRSAGTRPRNSMGRPAGPAFERRAQFAIAGDAQRNVAASFATRGSASHAFFGGEPAHEQRIAAGASPDARIGSQAIAAHGDPLRGNAVRDEPFRANS